jgi:hypothetical protein
MFQGLGQIRFHESTKTGIPICGVFSPGFLALKEVPEPRRNMLGRHASFNPFGSAKMPRCIHWERQEISQKSIHERWAYSTYLDTSRGTLEEVWTLDQVIQVARKRRIHQVLEKRAHLGERQSRQSHQSGFGLVL